MKVWFFCSLAISSKVSGLSRTAAKSTGGFSPWKISHTLGLTALLLPSQEKDAFHNKCALNSVPAVLTC